MRADFDNAGSQQGLLRRRRASVASSSKQNCLTKIKKLKKGCTAVSRKKTLYNSVTIFFFISSTAQTWQRQLHLNFCTSFEHLKCDSSSAAATRASVDALRLYSTGLLLCAKAESSGHITAVLLGEIRTFSTLSLKGFQVGL